MVVVCNAYCDSVMPTVHILKLETVILVVFSSILLVSSEYCTWQTQAVTCVGLCHVCDNYVATRQPHLRPRWRTIQPVWHVKEVTGAQQEMSLPCTFCLRSHWFKKALASKIHRCNFR